MPDISLPISRRPVRLALRKILATLLLGGLSNLAWSNSADDFSRWLEDLTQEARARGISEATLATALAQARPIERVLELDRRQPEFVDTFWNYLNRRVTPQRVEQGRRLLQTHGQLLAEAERRYGVPAHVLVAFWGLETHYGSHLGSYPVVNALATLAHDGRRSDFFRKQLLEALAILDAGHTSPETMVGSWAGAMGHLQFMPSTFQNHAVDGDGDGRKDLWNSLPDAFSSGANYLHQLGWQAGESWGREVRLPPGFDWQQAHHGVRKPLASWAALGVTQADGQPLPLADMRGAILLPQGHAGPAFLVYRNFDFILNWNRSISYALAVGHLADRLIGLPVLANGRQADNRRMSREDATEIQQRLILLGFDPGASDGVLGARTKAAIREFQHSNQLPADGYPSLGLLERLRLMTQELAQSGPVNATTEAHDG